MNPQDSGPGSSGGNTPSTSYTPSLSSSLSNIWSSFARTFSVDGTTGFPTQSSNHHNRSETSSSLYELPPLSPVLLSGYKERTRHESRLMSRAVAEEIRILIPERLKLVDEWKLIYSLVQDGASLQTMYHRAKKFSGGRAGFVLVVRDAKGGTFGAYLSEYPHPAHSYFGNGECFLWRATLVSNLKSSMSLPPPPSSDTTHLAARSTTLLHPDDENDHDDGASTKSTPSIPNPKPHTDEKEDLLSSPITPTANGPAKQKKEKRSVRFKAYPYSGLNDFFMNCETGFFSVGAGDGHYGLWLDSGLEHGHSARCETFGNEPLSDQGERFYIINTELWVVGS